MSNFSDITISDCGGVGMSVPSGTQDSFERINISNCDGGGLLVRDSVAQILQALKLPEHTPPELLLQVLQVLRDSPTASPEAKAELVNQSALGSFLEKMANATTVVTNLVNLSATPYLAPVISALGNFVR